MVIHKKVATVASVTHFVSLHGDNVVHGHGGLCDTRVSPCEAIACSNGKLHSKNQGK